MANQRFLAMPHDMTHLPCKKMSYIFRGPRDLTRTSTVLPPPAPQAGASTNFATRGNNRYKLPEKHDLVAF